MMTKSLIAGVLVIVLALAWVGSGTFRAATATPDYTLPLTVQPPATCGYCTDNLVGLTAEEIGDRVLTLTNGEMASIGTSKVLKVRAIKWEDAPALGMGCLEDFDTIETVPLAMVVLEGNFDQALFRQGIDIPRPPPGHEKDQIESTRTKYLAIIVDLWSATWMSIVSSNTTDTFRAAFEDKPLVKPDPWPCHERLVSTRHYGATFSEVSWQNIEALYANDVPGIVPTIPVPASEVVPHEIPTTTAP